MTPTMPLPPATRSLSLGMYEKSWVNELMLRSDGTVTALGDVAEVPVPPHAVATIATTPAHAVNVKRLSLRKSMGLSSPYSSFLCLLPGSFRGESAPATGLTQQPWRTPRRGEHCSGRDVCQEIDIVAPHNVRTLDKLA